MPAKGKHRRPRTQRLSRSIAAAGTGGAALALPLIGATGAHASTQTHTQSGAHTSQVSQASQFSQQSTALPQRAAAERTAARQVQQSAAAEKSAATTRTYSVKRGDYLSRIAEEQDVTGGWQTIYADNREAIGSNPSLIHPGLELTLGGKAPSSTGGSSSGSGSRASGGSDASAQKPQQSQQSQESRKSSQKSRTPQRKSQEADTQAEKPASSAQDTRTASGGGSGSGFTRPVSGVVGTAYRAAGGMWSSGYHTGVDFVVPTGTSLKAVGAGTVVSAGWGGSYGNQVVVRLADGHYAQYAHLSSLSVSVGQTVSVGQQVGLSGATGNVTGPHLHFEIRTASGYGSDVDPLAYLRSKGVSL
ncbi:peptidase [Streptomyces ruber]|uniref:Peptidase n=2 Tax=Streptomyces TaxID=1883 RepID=A0A918BSU6_9ACTN|nr:M23 family metallopeptidase [Streptomyces ruber]GGQ86128.1 peptidase [Streptomyces ruber]